MKVAILLITLLLIFLVQYVNRFMIYRRQKEFAIQCIMGMEQGLAAWLFFLETLVIGAFALVIELLLGAVGSQFIIALLLQMFHKPFQFSVMLFPDTVLLTVIFFFLCFAIIGLFQVRAMRKVKIIDILPYATVLNYRTDFEHRQHCRSVGHAGGKSFVAVL